MRFSHVLVTGGAGFVGSQLVRKLEPISEHIYVIDDLSAGNRNSVLNSDKITFYQDSITNEKLLEEVLPKVEWIFHLACRSLTRSVLNLHEDFHTNLYGGFLLLHKAKELCPQLKRMLYTSTASVYGNASVRPTPEHWHQLTTPYSASKFSVEHYCEVFYHMYRFPVTTVRLSNVFGPGQLPSNPYCGVVARFFEALENNVPMDIYGDGEQTRDFTYVEDAIEALLASITHPNSLGKLYNIGTGKETAVRQLATMISDVAGRPNYPITYRQKRVIDNVSHRSVDISAIMNDLQWCPKHSMQEGLDSTYQWLRHQNHSL